MARRVGNLPLRSGDQIVLRVGDEEETLTAKRNSGQKITATGRLGQMLLALTQKGDKAELEIAVIRRDAEGRELLHD